MKATGTQASTFWQHLRTWDGAIFPAGHGGGAARGGREGRERRLRLRPRCGAGPGWAGRAAGAGRGGPSPATAPCPGAERLPGSGMGRDGGRDPPESSRAGPSPQRGHLRGETRERVRGGLASLQTGRLYGLPGQPVPGLCPPSKESASSC